MSEGTSAVGEALMPTAQEILDVIKMLFATKPQIATYSVGMIGSIKIISNPLLNGDTIMVSDDVYRMLQEASKRSFTYTPNNS